MTGARLPAGDGGSGDEKERSIMSNRTMADQAKNYRLTSGELRAHLVNSGDPFPDETISLAAGSRSGINTSGGHVAADSGFFWVRTRTLRIPGWEE